MNDDRNTSRMRGRTALILFIIIIVAAALRIYRLDNQSFWLDEAYTAFKGCHPPGEVLHEFFKNDSNPPTYLLFAGLWGSIFGCDEFTLRFSSVFFAVCSVAMVYFLMKEIGESTAGLVAAGLLAVSPYHIWYSQEFRMYSLMMLMSLGAVFCLLRGARSARAGWWVAYAVLAILAYYVHLGSAIFIACANVFVLFNRREYKIGRAWIISNVAVLLACVPWLFVIQSAYARGMGSRLGMQDRGVRPSFIVYLVYEFLTGRSVGPSVRELHINTSIATFKPYLPATGAFGVVFGVAIVLGLVRAIRSRKRAGIVVSMIVLPVIVLVALVARTPLPLLARNILPVLPFLLLVIAWGIVEVKPRWLGGGILALMVLLCGYSLHNYYHEEKYFRDDYRSTLRRLKQDVNPERDVVIAVDIDVGFKYYGEDGLTFEYFPSLGTDWEEKIKTATSGKSKAWVVTVRPWDYDPKGRILQYFADNGDEIESNRFSYPGVDVRCFKVREGP